MRIKDEELTSLLASVFFLYFSNEINWKINVYNYSVDTHTVNESKYFSIFVRRCVKYNMA